MGRYVSYLSEDFLEALKHQENARMLFLRHEYRNDQRVVKGNEEDLEVNVSCYYSGEKLRAEVCIPLGVDNVREQLGNPNDARDYDDDRMIEPDLLDNGVVTGGMFPRKKDFTRRPGCMGFLRSLWSDTASHLFILAIARYATALKEDNMEAISNYDRKSICQL
ncbi:hypothetical protein MMC15_007418 [Xylographa vitiligo]|nr:hypothetical protein [Xylographa vitiligo]